MGRSLETDVRAAARSGGGRVARGSRVQFVLRRTRSAPLLPASLLLAVLVSVTVTTGLAGFAGLALPAAAQARLARAPATPIQVSGQFGTARARADESVIRSSVRSALGSVPFTLATGRWSDQLALPTPRGASQPPQIQAAVLSGVRSHVTLTAGTWPGPRRAGAPLAVALPVTTAGLLRLSVGQVLTLRDSLTGTPVRLRVTGLFRPRDPTGPYWRLSLLGTSGKFVQGTFVTYGPMLADRSILGPGGLPVSAASWLVTVDTAAIPPGQVGPLGHRLNALVASWRGRPDLGGLQVSTGLPQVLAELASSLVVSRSLLLIGSLQLLLLATAAAALAARLLASQREGETAMLSARGAARGQLLLASLAEAVLLAVTGALAGIVAGSYLTGRLMSANRLPVSHLTGGLSGVTAGDAWWPAVVIVVGVIVVMMWPSLRPVTPGTVRARRGRPAALAATARAGLDAALIALGVLAFWELRRYSAVPRLSGGTLGIDPVLAVAPVLALAGIALLPLRILPAAARLLDRLSKRGRRLAAALASWQVSRRAVREGSPVLLVILAVAIGTLALAQHQSWRQSQLDQAALMAGADVRVSLPAPLPLDEGGALARTRGVRSAMPVAAFDSGFSVLALGARQAAATVLLRPDLSSLPPAQLWRRITPAVPGPGLVLPGRPARLAVVAALRPSRAAQPGSQPGGVGAGPAGLGAGQVSLSVQDGSGTVYTVPAGTLPADGRDHDLTAVLDAAGGARYPLRFLGLTVGYQLPGFPAPPYPSAAARRDALRAEQRRAAARMTLAVRGLAVSPRASGGFPAPFAGGGALLRWHAAASAAGLADPQAPGVVPTVTSWRASGDAAALTFTVGSGHLVQAAGAPPQPVAGQLALTAGAPRLPIPVLATRSFASASGAHLGEVLPLPVGNVNIPVRLVAEVRAFPGAGSAGPAVIIDQSWLQQALAAQSQPPLPVTQWWLAGRPRPPQGWPAGASVVTWAGTAAQLLGDPLPNVSQVSLLVIVAAAGLLACVGFVVSVLAAIRERRLQHALLAALGVGRAGRAGQLSLEQLMLSVPGAVAGAVIGAALAYLLVPAVTLTPGGNTPFPPVRVVIPLGWTALLALGIAAVPVVVAAVAGAYRPDPAAGLRAGETG
jgi:hypothetical protein